MAKKMIVKGVGTFMARKPGGKEVITLGTLQNLRIDLNVEIEDIFGGDGLFAIDTLVRSKTIEITATDAKFDLDALQLMMGATVQEEVESTLWVLGEQVTTDATGKATLAFEPVGSDLLIREKDTNTVIDAADFTVATNTITALEHASKELVVNYKRTETVDLVDLLVDEVPFPVTVIHHGSFLQKDGSYQGLETELYSCRAKGTFSIDAQRSTASASSVSLSVIDPERTDGKLGTIKRYTATKRV